METNFEVGEVCKTREGNLTRIICVDRKNNDYPIVALTMYKGTEIANFYTRDGRFDKDESWNINDLVRS